MLSSGQIPDHLLCLPGASELLPILPKTSRNLPRAYAPISSEQGYEFFHLAHAVRKGKY